MTIRPSRGDEDTGSPKLGYAVSIPVFDTGQKAVIGSGVYLGTGGATLDTDAITKAWLARFGRTVTDQVVDAVTGRLEAPRRAGASATLAGQALQSWTPGDWAAPGAANDDGQPDRASFAEAHDAPAAMRRWMALAGPEQEHDAAGFESRALTQRDFVTGTSFALSGAGRGCRRRFRLDLGPGGDLGV